VAAPRPGDDEQAAQGARRQECPVYLAVANIDHTRTKTKSPQTNGISEGIYKTVLNEFYRIAFR
jgi:hypothetical protein